MMALFCVPKEDTFWFDCLAFTLLLRRRFDIRAGEIIRVAVKIGGVMSPELEVDHMG